MDFINSISLVTGGGSGIGLELSRQLKALGSTVYICGRRCETLKTAAEAHGLHPIAADVTVAGDQERILDEISSAQGHLDLLVNNAGIFGAYDFAAEEDAVDRIETEIGINAIAPLALAKRALPLLSGSRAPAILFIGSGVAYVPVAGTPVYSGTKALQHHAAMALRYQLAPKGIAVYEALPPVVDTDMGKVMKPKNLKVMQPQDLVSQILEGMRRSQSESVIGQSKQLRLMSRLAPALIFREMARTEFL